MEYLDAHMGPLIENLNILLERWAPSLAKLGFTLPSPPPTDPAGSPRVVFAQVQPANFFLCGGDDTRESRTSSAQSEAFLTGSRGITAPNSTPWGCRGVDDFPQEIDWADPGRAFAVRM